jgi:hypothetical protein
LLTASRELEHYAIPFAPVGHVIETSDRHALAIVTLICTALAGCGEEPILPPTAVGALMSIIPASHTISAGDSAEFRLQWVPARPLFSVAKCESSDSSVATVRRDLTRCTVLTKAPGAVTVTVQASTGERIAGQVTILAR